MNHSHRYITGPAAFIVLMMAASTAFSGPPAVDASRQRTANLSLAGLDLSQTADVQIARDRILHLAQKLCDRVWDPLSLSQHGAFVDCVDRATANAEPALQQLASASTRPAKLAAAQR
jgi:UrcA family protein